MKRFLLSALLSLCFLLAFSPFSFAGVEPYENFIKGKIKRNDTLLVQDEKFKNAKYNWSDITNISVKNTIAVRLTGENVMKNSFSCELRLKVEYLTSPDQQTPLVKNVTLKLNYSADKGAHYKYIDSYDFTGAYWVRVIVENIYSPEYKNNIPPFLLLSDNIVINRQYKFKPDAQIKPNITLIKGKTGSTKTTTPVVRSFSSMTSAAAASLNSTGSGSLANSGNQLQLSWAVITGAEEYDIEWTTVDHGNPYIDTIQQMYGGSAGGLNPALLDKIFLHDATRVTTANQTYTISLVSNDDYVLVRMRQAQYTSDGIRLLGDWNYTQDNGSYAVWPLSWHQPNLNWQYETDYAEEGKKKEVIQYFDGTLRSRQAVTINNTDQVNVVQENIYDEFGRATASILPAPVKETGITNPYVHYFTNFNLNASNSPYNIANVYGTTGSASCEFNPDSLNISSGASQYYSPNNAFLSDKYYNNYIPDASGRPLSVKQYTPDNTGRIEVQGGVGKTLQPGYAFPSYTTKYYYGKPDQGELDKLFGNDVGFASHYLKNMVMDPNGQISINYINASGKTIATALTGPAPATMDTVKSYVRPTVQKINILDSSKFVFDNSNLQIKATTTYLAALTGPAAITYTIQKLIDKFPGGTTPICSNCYYDLTIKVVNDCNNVIYTNTTPVQVGAQTADCNNTGLQSDSLNVNFPQIGEYYITFQLSFSKTVMENYVDQFVQQGQQNGYLQNEFSFILPYLDGLNYKGCLSDCQTCEQTLGTKASFIQIFSNKLLALDVDSVSVAGTVFQNWVSAKYDNLKAYCDSLQATCYVSASPCDQYESPMLADVSPGGQYALFDSTGVALEPQINVISNNWRTVFPVLSATSASYQSSLITLPDGTITSPNDASFTLAMLVQYWNPDWANYFLPYHPEYCKLQYCIANSSYENWDNQVQQTILTADAIPSIPSAPGGLQYDHNNAAWLVAADPFFQAGAPGATVKSSFLNDLNNYSLNVLKMNSASTKNLVQYVDFITYCSDPSGSTNTTVNPNNNWDNCTPNPACRVPDLEWNAYSDAYFTVKQTYYDKLRNAICGTQVIGTPYQLPTSSPCPVNSDFTITTLSAADGTPSVACDSPYQTLTLKYYPGKVTTAVTVNIAYSAGANITGLPVSFQFAPGDSSKMFCVPGSLPVQAVSVQSIYCANCQVNPLVYNNWTNVNIVQNTYNTAGTIVSTRTLTPDNTSYFNGVLTIKPANAFSVASNLHNYSGNWSMDENCAFSLYANGIKYTLYNVSGTQLSLGHKENNIEEIWYFSGPSQGTTTSCANPVALTVASALSATVYLEGVYPSRHQLTIIPGSSGSRPTFSCSSGTPASNFYNCLNVVMPNNTIAFQNVWVFDCVYDNPSSSAALYPGKVSRFDIVDTTMILSDPSALVEQNQTLLQQQTVSACQDGGDGWINALTPGLSGYSPAVIQSLRSALIDICSKGADLNHPFGASTVAPDSTSSSGYSSFGDAIKGVLGLTSFTSQLNPWLISAPYPYSPKEQSNPPIIAASNTSICNTLANLQVQCNQYNSSNGTNLSLYAYLLQVYGSAMTLSTDDFQVLQNSCGQCQFLLAHQLTMPVFLDPGATGCISATDFAAANSQLQAQFSGGLSTSDPNYQTIFTNFMNQKWGFMLSFDQYTDYQTLLSSSPAATLCNVPPYTTITADPLACIESEVAVAVANGKQDYVNYIIMEKNLFRASYISTCSAAKENVNLYAPQQTYHYTLYYYDQADNLVRTIPPEGVAFLADTDIVKVQTYRTQYALADSADIYNPALISQDTTAALNNLSGILGTKGPAGKSIELWSYNPKNTNNQLLATTPDHRFIFQTCITGHTMNIDIYAIDPLPDTVMKGRHYQVDISSKQPLQPWLHTVMLDTNFMAAAPQVYINGTSVPVAADSTAYGCGWTMARGSTPGVMKNDWATLKQLRFYTRTMSPQEIATNAANPYFLPSNQTAMSWYRFNVPRPGSPTTIDPGSTAEFKYLPVYPAHRLATSYIYNATNQVMLQQSPDGGINRYWYDLLSRLVISQNDNQQPNKNYSYTEFDPLGRITEVGQKNQDTVTIGKPDYVDNNTIGRFLLSGTNTEITDTYYDTAPAAANGIQSVTQNNLRKRVAASTYRDTYTGQVQQATYYNYDIDGNVSNLYQQIAGLGMKRIDYEYDLISGKVNFVAYQDGQPDQFYYGYDYDADNRLTAAWSGISANVTGYGFGSALDPITRRMDASYQYYLHGPLARLELGDVSGKVQGLDYAYTLQGWLKGMNSSTGVYSNDMGRDGTAGSSIPEDVVGYALAYFPNDYKPVGPVANEFIDIGRYANTIGVPTYTVYHPLYNGNISAQTTNIPALNTTQQFHTYQYDQLNRLKNVNTLGNNLPYNLYSTTESLEHFTYDGNGNISTAYRYTNINDPMGVVNFDNQTYGYNRDAAGNLLNNKLNHVNDTQAWWDEPV
jgi:hypothetical protein